MFNYGSLHNRKKCLYASSFGPDKEPITRFTATDLCREGHPTVDVCCDPCDPCDPVLPDFPIDFDPCCPCCKGEKGDRGDKGEKGDRGDPGVQGIQGIKGEKGDRGDKGSKGDPGIQGVQGVQGVKGDPGLPGAKGERGEPGLQGLPGVQGVKGDPGLPGAKGETGAQGVKGDKGDPGLQGIQGIQGVKGDRGETGATGAQGVQGVKGDPGLPGMKGETGAQGVKGDKGDPGLQGIQGIQGVKGDTGAQGAKGEKGDPGQTGPQGIQGVKGDRGEPGLQGIQGVQGVKGDPGCSCGTPGPTGAQGPAGARGAPGEAGPAGKDGGSLCPCEITMGKTVDFLLESGFPFTATVDAPFDLTLESTAEAPASLYNTWAVAFDDGTVLPLCKLESLQLSFTTAQEQETFVSLLTVLLNQTLSCCHSCGVCDVCPETLLVDGYGSIVDMPETCNYQYALKGACDCADSQCNVVADLIDPCAFSNTTGQKLRGMLERKRDEGSTVTQVSTQKAEALPTAPEKTIAATGLSSVLLTYEEAGAFQVALLCLERVTALGFVDPI